MMAARWTLFRDLGISTSSCSAQARQAIRMKEVIKVHEIGTESCTPPLSLPRHPP